MSKETATRLFFMLPAGLVVWLLVAIPNGQLPGKDSGVFLYIGQQLLAGKVPYRDIWDHKPPVIYLIDAVGLVIGQGATWGVWLLEFGAIYGSLLLSFELLRRAFGFGAGLFGSLVWLAGLGLALERGNFTEEFGLPLQFAALYLFWRVERDGWTQRWYAVVGLVTAVAFFLKPTLIGLPLAIGLYLLFSRGVARRWVELLAALGWLIVGGGAVVALIGGYLVATRALSEFVDQVVRYNFAYSSSQNEERLSVLAEGLGALGLAGLPVLAGAGWVCALFYLARARQAVKDTRPLLVVGVVALPLELWLVTLSGRLYLHYLITLLPVMALLSAFLVERAVRGSRMNVDEGLAGRGEPERAGVWVAGLLVAIVALVGLSLYSRQGLSRDKTMQAYQENLQAAVRYIEANTSREQPLLVWGAETSLHFLTRRPAATTFVYQYPLYTPGYQSAEKLRTFLDEIRASRPVLIIDCWAAPGSESVPPLDPAIRRQWIADRRPDILPPEMNEIFGYIDSVYQPAGKISEKGWAVYMYKGAGR